ncbi:MAG: purine-nucleoside phosphorylase [Clostridiaceae bacterium]|nr:purine-nucleoside phosphorylase [Clostridiaceae bacterium]
MYDQQGDREKDWAEYQSSIGQAAAYIRKQRAETPEILLVLGSGLGDLADQVEQPVVLPYAEIPGFPRTTVPGHSGHLLLGTWHGRSIAVMQGRFHFYEGHDMKTVVMPIRVMQQLGVRGLILTNAAGGVCQDMRPGDLMLIRDHISLWAESPLRGPNLDEYGSRFPDQSSVYDPAWADLAAACAKESGLTLHQGVYAYTRGPQFETPAEIRLLRLLGASAVGMSTVPEAIAAVHGGMRVLAISCITNLAAGILNRPLNHQEVIAVGKQAAAGTIRLLTAILERLSLS